MVPVKNIKIFIQSSFCTFFINRITSYNVCYTKLLRAIIILIKYTMSAFFMKTANSENGLDARNKYTPVKSIPPAFAIEKKCPLLCLKKSLNSISMGKFCCAISPQFNDLSPNGNNPKEKNT